MATTMLTYPKRGVKVQPIEFAVLGTGPFPLDMLRHDRCWPARSVDVVLVTATRETTADLYTTPRVVLLQGVVEPRCDRWRSFGWVVYGNQGAAEAARKGVR